jgi:ADP-heptose:LPS heptosyltransferase
MVRSRRILVIRPDRIGDVVLATPLIRAIRLAHPDCHLAAMVLPHTAPVLANNPHLNEIITDSPEATSLWQQSRRLRASRFDTALMLLPTKRHAWMLFFAGIRTRVGVGKKPYQSLTFMRTVSRNKYISGRHEADYCMDLGRLIGIEGDDLSVEVSANSEDVSRVREKLPEGRRLVGICPGSGHSSPNWNVDAYTKLAGELLRDDDAHIVLVGGPNERHLADGFGAISPTRITNTIGDTVSDLIATITCLDVLVSTSTGPMHIAAGVKTPTVSLFCPLPSCSPALWGPKGNRSEVVLPHDGFCQDQCPGDPKLCEFEGGITVEAVAASVRKILYP